LASRHSSRPPSTIARRLSACRKNIQQKRLDGYLVTNRSDQFYLTGFDGEDGAILVLSKRVYLLTDGRFAEEAVESAPWASAVIRQGALNEAIARLAKKHRLKQIGFQPARLSVRDHGALRKVIRPTQLVAMPPVIEKLRLRKDSAEIAAIEQAIRVAEEAFKATVRKISLGTTERQLAARLQHEMLDRGAAEASFPIIVAEGSNSSLPHAKPGDRKLRSGSAVLIDWGATVGHYRSDLTRVIFIRRIPPRFRRMYEQVLAAQAEAIDAIRPGVPMRDVDAKARAVLERVGMDRQFTHGLGHGIGLDIHEPPRLSKKDAAPLEAGMVVTVEPGVYFPGVGGVRIEDDVLVTEDGYRVLSSLSKKLNDMVV